MTSGYDQIYLGLIPKLQGCDLQDSAARLGLVYNSNHSVSVHFLNRDYLITMDGAEPFDDKPVNVNTRSVLLYYILSMGSGEPKYSYIPLTRLTGTIDGHTKPTNGIMNSPLIRRFGSDFHSLNNGIIALGGTYEGLSSNGSHSWLISPLPKLPMKLVFYEADDEFPADIQIMFDETATRFMEFECLAFLCGCLVGALIHNGSDIE